MPIALAFIAALLVLGLAAPIGAAPRSQPAPLQGVVTQVSDGDTVRFTPAGQTAIVVRLANIDAPEICQAWGPEARRALTDLALNKPATLRPTGRDSYGRTVGVLVVDGLDVAQNLVEGGHAWSLRGRNDTGPLVKQERMAKALNRGLHEGGAAIKPADFRRNNGPCPGNGAPSSAGPAAAPVVASTVAPILPARNIASPVVAAYRCDGRTHCSQMRSCDEAKYFLAHCPGVKMDGDHDGIPCEDQWCR
jgi:micrococcal nuclease